MAASPCDLLNALSQYELDTLAQLNKKFAALQQLARLLEQLGDEAAAFINNLQNFIGNLIPVVDIDVNFYLQMASACPFLNLPAISGGAGINSSALLQALVTRAYNNVTSSLLKHPYSRMGALQNEMSSFMNKVSSDAAMGAGIYQCLQAACNGTLFTAQGSAAVNAQINQYQQNFVVAGGNVLPPAAQAKAVQVQTLIGTMQGLGATTGLSYAAAKIKLNAAQTVAA